MKFKKEDFKHLWINDEIIEYILNIYNYSDCKILNSLKNLKEDELKWKEEFIFDQLLEIIVFWKFYKKTYIENKILLRKIWINRIFEFIKNNDLLDSKVSLYKFIEYFDEDWEKRFKMRINYEIIKLDKNIWNSELFKKIWFNEKNYIFLLTNNFNLSLNKINLNLKNENRLKNDIFNCLFKNAWFLYSNKSYKEFLMKKKVSDVIKLVEEYWIFYVRDAVYELVKNWNCDKEEKFLFDLIDWEFWFFERYFKDKDFIYENKENLKKEIDEFKKNWKFSELKNYVLLDNIIYKWFTYNDFLKKEFFKELREIYWFTVHYHKFDIEKLMKIWINEIKRIIEEKQIDYFSFKNALKVFFWELDDNWILDLKKYDLLQNKFWWKFTSLSKDKIERLFSNDFSFEDIKSMNKRSFNKILNSMREEENIKNENEDNRIESLFNYKDEMYFELKEEELEELRELVWWWRNYSSLHNDMKYLIIKKIWLDKSKEILKRYKSWFWIWKAKFLKNYFYWWEEYINREDLILHYWDEFMKSWVNNKRELVKMNSEEIIKNIKKWELIDFILRKRWFDLDHFNEIYESFREEYWQNFTSFPKSFREIFMKEWIEKIKNFQNEHSLSNENTLKWFLYWKDLFKKWKLVCDNCWEEYEINWSSIYKLQQKLNFCDCKRFRSRFEKIIHDFVKNNYKWEIMINKKFLKIEWRTRELDIYLPDLKFWIEFNWHFYHWFWENNIDDWTKLKINETKRLWIDLLILNENDFLKRTELKDEIKEKILKKIKWNSK